MKLSIIIPVYQTEATLEQCVRSVLSQLTDEMEIILVDDGATDNSPALCDQLAADNKCIHVIHQPNQGLSAARNTGIAEATGTYVTFIDSDDFTAPDTFAPLLRLLNQEEQVDILEYPAVLQYGSDRQKQLNLQDRRFTTMESYWLETEGYTHTYAWNKLFRRSLFDDICFPEGLLFEDAHTIPKLLSKARVIATTTEGLYYYRHNPKGITATADGLALKSLLEAHLRILSTIPSDSLQAQVYYMHLVNIQMDVYELTDEVPVLPLRTVSSTRLRGLMKAKAILLNTLGIKRLCTLNKALHKIWRNR